MTACPHCYGVDFHASLCPATLEPDERPPSSSSGKPTPSVATLTTVKRSYRLEITDKMIREAFGIPAGAEITVAGWLKVKMVMDDPMVAEWTETEEHGG